MAVNGLHHISMIVHHPQKTIDFYQGILKLKLIKQTVNFDDPYTYHLYFGNKNQAIGSLVTFFPWLGGKKGKLGDGQVYRIQFKIPKGALPYWEHRFNENQVNVKSLTDTNHKGILFYDPDNIAYELIETNTQSKSLDINGFHGIKLYSAMPYKTKDTLINLLDFTLLSEEKTHIHLENNAYHITIKYSNQTSAYGVGSVHHVAFSLENDELMVDVIDKLKRSNHHPTSVKDRLYFKSVYFKEPGGNLFEIATNNPGFLVDESIDTLGTSLKIPPIHQDKKTSIIKRLMPLELRQDSEEL